MYTHSSWGNEVQVSVQLHRRAVLVLLRRVAPAESVTSLSSGLALENLPTDVARVFLLPKDSWVNPSRYKWP